MTDSQIRTKMIKIVLTLIDKSWKNHPIFFFRNLSFLGHQPDQFLENSLNGHFDANLTIGHFCSE